MVKRIFDCMGNYIIPHTFLRYKDKTIHEVQLKYRFGLGYCLGIKMNGKFVALSNFETENGNKLIDFVEISELKSILNNLKEDIVLFFNHDEKARYILIHDPAYMKQYLCSVFEDKEEIFIPLILYKAIGKYVVNLPKHYSDERTIIKNLIRKRY